MFVDKLYFLIKCKRFSNISWLKKQYFICFNPFVSGLKILTRSVYIFYMHINIKTIINFFIKNQQDRFLSTVTDNFKKGHLLEFLLSRCFTYTHWKFLGPTHSRNLTKHQIFVLKSLLCETKNFTLSEHQSYQKSSLQCI